MNPVGGMAEFIMALNEEEAAIPPAGVSGEQGASCGGAIIARDAVVDYVKEGDRVMVLGGSGGVGSAAIQIAKKHAKASFVSTTSTQSEFCILELGADRVIVYRSEDWWTVKEYRKDKFDVIIDTVGGGNYYGRAEKVLKTGKEGGTFVTVTGDDPQPDCRTYAKLLKFFSNMLGRIVYTKLKTDATERYVALMPYE